jgi:hypothetical protein
MVRTLLMDVTVIAMNADESNMDKTVPADTIAAILPDVSRARWSKME